MRLRCWTPAAWATAVGAALVLLAAAPTLAAGDSSPHDALQGVAHRVVVPTGGIGIAEGSSTTETTWRVDEPDVTDFLIIGSSMMTAFKQDWARSAYDLLASRIEFRLDARGCRSLIRLSCSTSDAPPPPNVIDALRSHAGDFDKGLVIVAGANDHETYGEFGIEAAMNTILDEATRQGIRWVVWVLYREVGPKGPRFVSHNAVVREVESTEPRFILADWNTKAADYPASWFNPDGIHLGTMGALKLAELIADTLDLIDRAGQGPTLCRLARLPFPGEVVSWTEWSDSAVPADATRVATRLHARCVA